MATILRVKANIARGASVRRAITSWETAPDSCPAAGSETASGTERHSTVIGFRRQDAVSLRCMEWHSRWLTDGFVRLGTAQSPTALASVWLTRKIPVRSAAMTGHPADEVVSASPASRRGFPNLRHATLFLASGYVIPDDATRRIGSPKR